MLIDVATQIGATVPQVAHAWVRSRPGVSSVIMGATSVPQLDENLKALDVQLSSEHLATLDKASRPTLNWPAEALANIGTFGYGGTKINGETFPVNPRAPQNDGERY